MNEKDVVKEILEIIDVAVAKVGYKVLDGDAESIIIRNPKTDRDFEIKVEEIIP